MPRRALLAFCVVAAASAACAFLTRRAEPSPPGKPFSFSILEDYDKGDDLAAVARDFNLFNELEVTTWRGSFGWDDYEPERGHYDFQWLHAFIALAEEQHITLRPYIGYTPEWAAGGPDTDKQAWNQPPRSQAEWQQFVTALSQELRHHRNVPSVEIYNEQNVTQWWEGTRADYAETLRSAAAAVRRAGPFQILVGGLTFPDLDFVEDVCAGARDFDVLPVHAYPETWTPKDVTVENYLGRTFGTSFVAEVDRNCGPKRIWINETGYATTPGRSEHDQSAWWVRAIATFAAEPRVEHVGIYEIKDLPSGKAAIGDTPNYHLGLIRSDGTRKSAFATVDLMTDLLDVGRLTVVTDTFAVQPSDSPNGELHHQAFLRPDGDRVLVVWNRTAAERVRVQFPAGMFRVVEYSLDGSTRTTPEERTVDVALTAGTPRIFRLTSK